MRIIRICWFITILVLFCTFWNKCFTINMQIPKYSRHSVCNCTSLLLKNYFLSIFMVYEKTETRATRGNDNTSLLKSAFSSIWSETKTLPRDFIHCSSTRVKVLDPQESSPTSIRSDCRCFFFISITVTGRNGLPGGGTRGISRWELSIHPLWARAWWLGHD